MFLYVVVSLLCSVVRYITKRVNENKPRLIIGYKDIYVVSLKYHMHQTCLYTTKQF